MQLFTRSVLMTGAPAAYTEYATEMCGYVSERSGREVSLWATWFGAPVGTMTYSLRVEGLADLQAATARVIEDPAYHERLDAGRSMLGAPSVDALATPVHGELGDPPPVGSVGMVTMATMAAGKYTEAVGWGVEISQHVETIADVPVMFLTANYGRMGEVAWIGVVADAAAADAAQTAISGDADYLGKVNSAAGLFVEGSGNRSVVVRIA